MTSGRLDDKTILIVGGTSGLGLSAARACVSAGAQVVVVGRDEKKTPRPLHRSGTGCAPSWVMRCYLKQRIAPCAAVETFGGLDGLYHVAGGSGRSRGDGPLGEISDQGWDFTLRLNLDSLFYSNRAAIRYWRDTNRGGAILNMASVLGFAPSAQYFATHAYAAAKAAIIGLTKSAAAYYAPHRIRVNALAPALIETPMAQRALQDEEIMRFVATKQPLDGGRIGQPADLDDAVVYFLSDESRFVTGQILAIDGGWGLSNGQVGKGNPHD